MAAVEEGRVVGRVVDARDVLDDRNVRDHLDAGPGSRVDTRSHRHRVMSMSILSILGPDHVDVLRQVASVGLPLALALME